LKWKLWVFSHLRGLEKRAAEPWIRITAGLLPVFIRRVIVKADWSAVTRECGHAGEPDVIFLDADNSG
jgi:hypothetical protein